MDTLFSTHYLSGVVGSLKTTSTFLLDRYFPSVTMAEAEEIHFDVIDKTRRLAPFVSPLVAGKILMEKGFSTKTFKPAYIKQKTAFNPSQAIRRVAGEAIGGNKSIMQRHQERINMVLIDHVDTITRRLEWMAAKALVNGKIEISGDNYQSVIVDFGRNANHTVTLTGANRWGQSGVKPLELLDEWKLAALKESGANLTDVIMSPEAWVVFKEDAQVEKRFIRFQGSNQTSLQTGAPIGEGASFMGTLDGYNIYVYAGWYLDDNGDESPMLPEGTVLLLSQQIEGTRAFGAILDESSLMAQPIFTKSWVENDPSVRWIMSQSAPLIVPTRVNASFSASVL